MVVKNRTERERGQVFSMKKIGRRDGLLLERNRFEHYCQAVAGSPAKKYVDIGNPNSFSPRAVALPPEIAPWVNQEGTWWFDSALPDAGRQCLLAVRPSTWLRGNLFTAEGIHLLEDHLSRGKNQQWSGGLAGAVTYEGDFIFGVYPTWHPWDISTERWLTSPPSKPECSENPCSPPKNSLQSREAESFSLTLQPAWNQEEFENKVRKIQEWIAAGDIYQACLTYPWEGNFLGSPWKAYQAFREKSPAPMGAFARLPEDVVILSASPELFLRIENRSITTRPIKGTRARGARMDDEPNTALEKGLAAELQCSEKERAELTMITDLERNDLGQICSYGSIHVQELLKVEHFAQVLHLVSTIEGSLREEVSHPAALAACFPGGSISGAPKKRAREILSSLERGPRGIYTGALGYLGFLGTSQFSIPIRTLVLKGGKAVYGSGAGIVADSQPEKEWAETLAKARGILELCATAS